MYVPSSQRKQLAVPQSLRAQMFDFRRRLWSIKLVEAAGGTLFGVFFAFLVVFVMDRLWDTPPAIRLAVFVSAALTCAFVPLALHRWVWRRRKLEQLARLLSRRHPSIGDQILGIIELARSESEQERSLELCEAAIAQVADQSRTRDFSDAVPNPKHTRRVLLAGLAVSTVAALCLLFPAASSNAWARFLMPWRETPRYTFAMVERLPDKMIVPHGEPFSFSVRLAADTASRPAVAEVSLGGQTQFSSRLTDGHYEFELPQQIDTALLHLRVGDYTKQIRVEPTLRPELSSLLANVALPEYLQHPDSVTKDIRGGIVSLVNGSRATLTATATRELVSATVDGSQLQPTGTQFVTSVPTVDGERKLEFEWHDGDGLAGREPFTLTINGREDQPPTIACGDLPRRKVVLDTEQLTFRATAQDDFGVRRVGIRWQGFEETSLSEPANGERVLSAGAPSKDLLELTGTFSASSLGIEPQPILVRLFVEDYYPERERVYSSPYLFYVLDAEQHAVWLTEQLSKWHRQSLDVRDRELQLYETNKELRELTTADLDAPENRKRIETQASAERTNGRRLSGLVMGGEELIQQAMRNPEFGVGHLEKWAEMLQILKDISANRMPSVADLLKQASQAATVAQAAPSKSGPMAGQVRAAGSGKSSPSEEDEDKAKPAIPTLVDVESSHQPLDQDEDDEASPPSGGGPAPLRLPTTMLLGKKKGGNEACPVGDKMDEAIVEQKDLLAEFEKIADELNRLLANLEGSTLVKRLKAASRVQYKIAGAIGDQVDTAFGLRKAQVPVAQRGLFKDLSEKEVFSSQDVSNIMDDMQAYFERRRFMQFQVVLEDMREQDVVGSMRQLADNFQTTNGLAMAQCEYWSDSLDRWAEDLVEPTAGGT